MSHEDPFSATPAPDESDERFNTDGLSLTPIDGVPQTIFDQTGKKENWVTTPDRGVTEVVNKAFESGESQGIESGNNADPALNKMRATVNAAEVAASEALEQERIKKEIHELFSDEPAKTRIEKAGSRENPSSVNEIMKSQTTLDKRVEMMRNAGLTNTAQFKAMMNAQSAEQERALYDEKWSFRNDAIKKVALFGPVGGAAIATGAIMAGIGAAPAIAAVGLGVGVIAAGGYATKKIGGWWVGRKADKAARDAGLVDGKGKFWQK